MEPRIMVEADTLITFQAHLGKHLNHQGTEGYEPKEGKRDRGVQQLCGCGGLKGLWLCCVTIIL